MNESVKAVLDNYEGFRQGCVRITELLRKDPTDSYDTYILDEFYPIKYLYKYDYEGYTIVGLHNEYECGWSAEFPASLLDMTDEEIISWRKENLGY